MALAIERKHFGLTDRIEGDGDTSCRDQALALLGAMPHACFRFT